jgi:hypothetical protein
MYGIEKDNYKNVVTMATCSRSYGIVMDEAISVYKYDKKDVTRNAVTNGIVAQSQLVWLIRRGDLLLSDIHKESEKRIVYHFKGGDSRKFKIPIYEYLDDDEKEPTRFETAKRGGLSFLCPSPYC